jgi:dihydrofolate synthase/folylpolyglutamate synthase
VDGEMIGAAETAGRLTELRALVQDWEPHPTFFELTTVLALRHFKEHAVDVVALETGMGGRLDATNIVTPAVSVITPIALDHMEWLGDSLAKIAGEKAGIIKTGVPAVSARQAPEAGEVLRRAAAEMGTRLRTVEKPWNDSEAGLPGAHQRENAALAVAALEEAGIDVPAPAIVEGLAKVTWRARFERLRLAGGGELILDGAHNPGAAKALSQTWREVFGGEKATIVFGAVESKDVEGILGELSPLAERIIFTAVNSPRALSPEKLAHAAKGRFEKCETALFLAGEVLTLLGESANTFEKSAQ